MAKDSEIKLPDGSVISGNWATEDTMEEILSVLQKKYGKSNNTPKKSSNDEHIKQVEASSKAFKALNGWVNNSKTSIKARIKSETDLILANENASEAVALLRDTSDLAGKGFKGLVGKVDTTINEFDKLDGSLKGTNDAFFKVAGGAGAIGTAFGVAAGVIDQFAEFQTSALQTGFSFSQELVNTRGNVAGLGMNMKQLSDIIVNNGEAVNSLGGNSASSANAFINLIKSIKASTRDFGLFGMTTEEIAGLTAERIDLLRRQGFVESVAINSAKDSFKLLNQEVLAYAKLTGKERREIMRNNLSMRDDSALILADLAKLGPNATVSFDSIMQNMSAVFGNSSDEFASIFTSMVTSQFRGGMEMLSSDQLAALQQVPGLHELFETAANNFMQNANNPSAMKSIQLDFARQAGDLIQNADIIDLAYYQQDNPVGDLLKSIVGAGQAATNFLNKSNKEQDAAFTATMAESEQQLLMIRDRIQILQNSFMASLLEGFGFGKLEDVLNDDNFNSMQSGISEFGDGLKILVDGFKDLVGIFTDSGNGSLVDEMVVGAGLLFASTSPFTIAMIAGANALWAGLAGVGGAGAVTSASKGVGWMSKLAPMLKKIPYIGTGIAGASGVIDDDYKKAGYNWFDRASLGIFESAADIGDFGWNVLTGAASTLGVGPGWDNNVDMSAAFKEWATTPEVAGWTNYIGSQNSVKSTVPGFDPKLSSDYHSVPSTLIKNQDATVKTDGSIVPNGQIDNSVAWRFSNEQLKRMADAVEENNRLARRQIDAIENN